MLLLKSDCFHWSSSPDKRQREDIVRVDSNEPITVLRVRVRVWVVRRQDKPTGASKVSSTRRYNGNKRIEWDFLSIKIEPSSSCDPQWKKGVVKWKTVCRKFRLLEIMFFTTSVTEVSLSLTVVVCAVDQLHVPINIWTSHLCRQADWAASSICYPLVYRWFCRPPGARIQGHTERTQNPPAHGHLHYDCHSSVPLGPCRL